MGSFNITCTASRQVITEGDRCVVMAVMQNCNLSPVEGVHNDKPFSQFGMARGRHQPTRFWTLVSPCFDAVYGDYGAFVLDDTLLNRQRLVRFLADCLDHLPVVHKGQYAGDRAFNLAEFMAEKTPELHRSMYASKASAPEASQDELFAQAVVCWDHIYEQARLERLFWSHVGGLRPLAYSVIHRDAYDALLQEADSWSNWDKESLGMRAVFDRAMTTYHAEAPEKLDPSVWDDSTRRTHQYGLACDLRERFTGMGNSEGRDYPGESRGLHKLTHAFVEGTLSESELFAGLVPWMETRYAMAAMAHYNISLSPVEYAGQDNGNRAGKAFAQFVNRVSAKVTRAGQEKMYGSFLRYSLVFKDMSVLGSFGTYMREQDTPIELVGVKPVESEQSHTLVTFDSPIDFADLKEALADYFDGIAPDCLLQDTLTEIALSE